MSRAIPWLIVALALVPRSVSGQTVVGPEDRTALQLTVYDGFAQVTEARRAGGGSTDVAWTGIPDAIDPGTVVLRAADAPLAVASQTFDPGAGSEGQLLARRVGRPVTLVAPSGERIPATVAAADGPVYRAGDRLIVDWRGAVELPAEDDATSGPTLRFRLERAADGPLTARYLTGGVSWSADYTAVLLDEGTLSLEATIELVNATSLDFPGASIGLVAGDVRRVGGATPIPIAARMQPQAAYAAAAPPTEQSFGDVHLYLLPEPVTLESGTTTRATLFRAPRVPVERTYLLRGQSYWFQGPWDGERRPLHPTVRLRFSTGDLGQARPLPAGVLHTYRPDAGGTLRFSGDAPIPATPENETVSVEIGSAFDIVADRTQTDFRRVDTRTTETAWQVTIRNHADGARAVQVLEPVSGDWTIVEESQPHERVDADTVRWNVSVPRGGETTLTYRVRAVS